MLRNSRIAVTLALAIGGLGGWIAASGRLPSFSIAQAETIKPPAASTQISCCDSADRSVMLARAETNALVAHNNTVAANLQASGKKPNIVFIMGDDVGWFNIGAYHRGIMSGKTPNLDKLASPGASFTDYYAEASCTAGRANFITGEIPLRTGLTTVGQAGADVGIPAQACTIATALKAQGYATGQFGKNHLGDLNKYLPTVHGFDE